MDDAMMILGALTISAGVALVFLPAGLIVIGVALAVGGYARARVPDG